jgi:uncharacterized membrane protein
MVHLFSLAIGIMAGLRTMTAPAAVSWGAYLGVFHLSNTWFAFLGKPWSPWVLSVLALGELITDQLPGTPSRTVPLQFSARVFSGAFAGAAIAVTAGSWIIGALAGASGAVIGTLGGRATRAWLASAFGRDRPAAFIEDAVAIGAACLIVVASS